MINISKQNEKERLFRILPGIDINKANPLSLPRDRSHCKLVDEIRKENIPNLT